MQSRMIRAIAVLLVYRTLERVIEDSTTARNPQKVRKLPNSLHGRGPYRCNNSRHLMRGHRVPMPETLYYRYGGELADWVEPETM